VALPDRNHRCLNALRARRRRSPEPPEAPAQAPEPPEPTRVRDPVWLEPYPDSLLEGVADQTHDPEVRYEAPESIGLAFVTALQGLPPRQRAALVLRDVLGFRATEVASMLDSSEASVNSALHRARSSIERDTRANQREEAPRPDSAAERELVARFTEAFEGGDIDGVVALLTDDALLTMPPEPLEYEGPAAIASFLRTVPAGGRLDRIRLSRPAPTASRRSVATCAIQTLRSRTPTGSWSSP
jgi:RNA polymerase sigma-70 factor, ECF subfamily